MEPLFYHSKPEKGMARVTLCGMIIPNDDHFILRVGTARCGDNDIFLKEKGRLIASGRAMKKPKITILCDTAEDARQIFYEKSKEIAEHESLFGYIHK